MFEKTRQRIGQFLGLKQKPPEETVGSGDIKIKTAKEGFDLAEKIGETRTDIKDLKAEYVKGHNEMKNALILFGNKLISIEQTQTTMMHEFPRRSELEEIKTQISKIKIPEIKIPKTMKYKYPVIQSTPTMEKVLDIAKEQVQKKGFITPEKLSEETGMDSKKSYYYLNKLLIAGKLIKRERGIYELEEEKMIIPEGFFDEQ